MKLTRTIFCLQINNAFFFLNKMLKQKRIAAYVQGTTPYSSSAPMYRIAGQIL